jgi:hypothetical protein
MKRAGMILFWLALSSTPSLAWNEYGHMAVAALAWDRLSDRPEIQAKITALLIKNPLYETWTDGVSGDIRDKVGFMMAATWADIIKRDHQHIADGAAGSHGDRPAGTPDDSRNIGYSDNFMHKYWHFIDQPFSPEEFSSDDTRLPEPEKPNVQTRIADFRATLSPNSGVTDEVRSYDLTWLLHLVGDVHQPLHATSRFTRDQPDGDDGGNRVKIKCGPRTPQVSCHAAELHAFWDDVLGPSNATPESVIDAEADFPDPNPALAAIADEKVWMKESFDKAQEVVYVQPIGVEDKTYNLTKAYKEHAFLAAQERVSLAAARLANLLADALR